ncbi:hypothetical protein AcV5_002682 [Taiwanofungus camphoratus]|nr:hypothetical protein AcV5_002682 [Antrodia cinnamomea]KAI0924897.1 hypothetical protein AcW2_005637 [Antrodia cinnamomea]
MAFANTENFIGRDPKCRLRECADSTSSNCRAGPREPIFLYAPVGVPCEKASYKYVRAPETSAHCLPSSCNAMNYEGKTEQTLSVTPLTSSRLQHARRWLYIIPIILGLHFYYSFDTSTIAKGTAQQITDPEFDWFSLVPSEEITWSSCFSGYKCARLILPLDYLSPSGAGPNATIALQMIPATDMTNYRGTILINPGGPGGSGTSAVSRYGMNISRVVGGSYDVLGFDPRGTGASTPSADCFDSESQFKIWTLQAGDRFLNLSDGSVEMARAKERVVGQRCLNALGGNGREETGTVKDWGAGRFMSTASVATDMLKIVEKLGQEKLLYWGFSYGSVLGQYFSAMYPDKVGRVVIDGVYDAYNYRGSLWNSNLADTDAVVQSFYAFCHRAGPVKCPLYESTADKVQARVDTILRQLEEEPVATPFASGGPIVLTKKVLHEFMFRATYKPTAMFNTVADALVAVERNNQTALSSLASQLDVSFECKCKETPQWLAENEAFYAIACGDGDPVSYSPDNYTTYFNNLSAVSPFASPIWGIHYLQCTEWRIRPKWRYTGPLAAANTSHPLLLISPQYDPVCPLADARKVHQRYGGSGLLVQNSYGHCSISSPSLCTAKHVRAYFLNGTLPEEGTVCEPDELPFVGVVNREETDIMSTDDKELLDALRVMAEEVPRLGNF